MINFLCWVVIGIIAFKYYRSRARKAKEAHELNSSAEINFNFAFENQSSSVRSEFLEGLEKFKYKMALTVIYDEGSISVEFPYDYRDELLILWKFWLAENGYEIKDISQWRVTVKPKKQERQTEESSIMLGEAEILGKLMDKEIGKIGRSIGK